MKSRAPQLHLEYRFYKQLGQAGKKHKLWRYGLKKTLDICKIKSATRLVNKITIS